jgi:hypothetical protein
LVITKPHTCLEKEKKKTAKEKEKKKFTPHPLYKEKESKFYLIQQGYLNLSFDLLPLLSSEKGVIVYFRDKKRRGLLVG